MTKVVEPTEVVFVVTSPRRRIVFFNLYLVHILTYEFLLKITHFPFNSLCSLNSTVQTAQDADGNSVSFSLSSLSFCVFFAVSFVLGVAINSIVVVAFVKRRGFRSQISNR